MTKLTRVLLLSAVLLATCAGSARAQTTTFGGQVRPRLESRTDAEPVVSMRTRAQLSHVRAGAAVLVQIQDVRLWGEELSTTADFSADALDVHQAWLTLGSDSTWLRVGRQELSFGDERLVGAVGWLQQGRAFDGLRVRVPVVAGVIDLIGLQLGESAAAAPVADRELAGAYATWTAQPLRAEAFLLADGHDEWRWTAGGRLLGRTAALDWRGEMAVQRGGAASRDVAAWMVGASIGRDAGPVGVTLWYDRLSGDDETADGTSRVFDTLFGTNHRYYGHADVFTEIPAHTGGRGLQDVALIVDGTVARTTVELALHRFDAAADDGLRSSRFGEEIDLTLGRPVGDGVRLAGGVSWLNSGPALAAERALEGDRWFGYVMLDALF